MDIFSEFIVNYYQLYVIIVTIIIGGLTVLVLFTLGVKRLDSLLLCLCLVFIYLYSLDLISIRMFGGVSVILAIVLIISLRTGGNEDNGTG